MATLPIEILLGLYLGLLTGIIPAFVSGALGFLVRYVTGVTLPGFGVVVLALAIASVNGGLLALVDPTILNSPRLLVAALVVLMLSLYAHNQGDKLGTTLPRRVSLRSLRRRTISADVVEFVGGIGQVTIRPAGEIRDVEGYPPLSADLRASIRESTWRLPADLPLSELEVRLAERLRTDHDLAEVTVSIDERGRATIAAAPPSSGLSRRVPEGKRAVSIATLAPTGLARGDRVTVTVPAGTDDSPRNTVDGTVLSARTPADADGASGDADDPEASTDGGELEEPKAVGSTGRSTAGGDGRVTIAVSRREAPTLLAADRGRVFVRSTGTSHEFEALSLLKRAGKRVRKVTVAAEGLDERTVGELRDADEVRVIAVRGGAIGDADAGPWRIDPASNVRVSTGDDLFVVGAKPALDRFAEAIAR